MKKSIRRRLKTTFFRVLDLLGFNAVFRRKYKNSIRIFTFHGVADFEAQHEWRPLRDQLSVVMFREYLATLSKHYRFVGMDEAIDMLRGHGKCGDNTVVLSFDDGYRNNFTEALPVMTEFDAPGIFYIATDFVESRRPFWFDRLDYVLQVAAREHLEFEIAGRSFVLGDDSREAVATLYESLRRHCKASFIDDQDFSSALDELATYLEVKTGVSISSILEDDRWAAVISSAEITALANDALVEFGSHTVHHTRLSHAELPVIQNELSESKSTVEAWTAKECKHFAYPNGDSDEQSARAAELAGYASAVTTDPGMNSVGDNLYTINRLNVRNDFTRAELLARASGLEAAIAAIANELRSLVRFRSD